MAGVCKGGNEPPGSLKASLLVSYIVRTYIHFINILLENKLCGRTRREFRHRFPGPTIPCRKTTKFS